MGKISLYEAHNNRPRPSDLGPWGLGIKKYWGLGIKKYWGFI